MPPPISKQVGGNGARGYNPKRKPDPTDNILDRIAPIGFDDDDGLKLLLYGRSGCLAADTFINYDIRCSKTGKVQNRKGGMIAHLYRRFNGIRTSGKGYYQRPQTTESDYYVCSITDDGRIVRNLVTDVLDSGTRQVFEITTESGKTIRATANHEFMTEFGYKTLASLEVGDEVLLHPGRRIKQSKHKKRIHRPEVMVKYHPTAGSKVIHNQYIYHRVRFTRLVYEARMNGMTVKEYRCALNSLPREVIDKFWTVPEGAEIHHIDENPINDVFENLVVTESSSEHQRKYHYSAAVERPGMSIYVLPEKIASIMTMGTERVYDICVADPFRNFVANGFAVHNSGKTTLWATFPSPILALVCSGGSKPGELRSVDTEENKKRIKTAVVHHSNDVKVIIDHINRGEQEGQRPFNTLVLDHATGLQDKILAEIIGLKEIPAQKGWGLATQQQYGQCTLQSKELLKGLLSLSCNVVIVAQDRVFNQDENGRMGDLIQPFVGAGLTPSLTGWLNCAVDYIVYTFKRAKQKQKIIQLGDGKTIETTEREEGVDYCLRIGADDVITTKFRTPKRKEKIPDVLVNPNYKKILAVVKGKPITL